jgi:hypothetical protein
VMGIEPTLVVWDRRAMAASGKLSRRSWETAPGRFVAFVDVRFLANGAET